MLELIILYTIDTPHSYRCRYETQIIYCKHYAIRITRYRHWAADGQWLPSGRRVWIPSAELIRRGRFERQSGALSTPDIINVAAAVGAVEISRLSRRTYFAVGRSIFASSVSPHAAAGRPEWSTDRYIFGTLISSGDPSISERLEYLKSALPAPVLSESSRWAMNGGRQLRKLHDDATV